MCKNSRNTFLGIGNLKISVMSDEHVSRSRSRDASDTEEESSSDSEETLLLNEEFKNTSSKVKRRYKQNFQS